MATRRLLLVGFPLTVPLWLLALFFTNLALSCVKVWEPIARFWNAPPKRLSAYTYGEYRSRPTRGAKVVDLPLPEKDAA